MCVSFMFIQNIFHIKIIKSAKYKCTKIKIEKKYSSLCTIMTFHPVTKFGAEKRTARVDITVKVTQIQRHRRSITMAANRHSARTTTSSSSRLHRVVNFLSSFKIDKRSDLVLRNGESPGFGTAPFSIRMSSSNSSPGRRHLDCRSCTTMS